MESQQNDIKGQIIIAGFWRRVLAAGIDSVVRLVAVRLLFAISGLFQKLDGGLAGVQAMVAILLGSAVYVGYALTGEALYGQTVGKWALKMKLVYNKEHDKHGIGFKRAIGRRLVRVLSMLAFNLGHVWSLLSAERQTWHDKASKTIVVHDPRGKFVDIDTKTVEKRKKRAGWFVAGIAGAIVFSLVSIGLTEVIAKAFKEVSFEAASSEWREYTFNDKGHFSIAMPTVPLVENIPIEGTEGGESKQTAGNRYSSTPNDDIAYFINVEDSYGLKNDGAEIDKERAAMLWNTPIGSAIRIGGTVIAHTPSTFLGNESIEYEIQNELLSIRGIVFFADNVLYQLVGAVKKEQKGILEFDKFAKSFILLGDTNGIDIEY